MCHLLVQETHEFAELLDKQDLEEVELLGISCAFLELLSLPSFFPVRLYLRGIFPYWEISVLTCLITLEQVWIS